MKRQAHPAKLRRRRKFAHNAHHSIGAGALLAAVSPDTSALVNLNVHAELLASADLFVV